ncbi:helix-turn-helix domain-containing protein [Arachidicoccus sp.]|uniref:helix-turn-helix domain-containing protein n=1 Tax=Arachidicoccus sp. TaxID=1872624 RepID=UPI003D1969E8
MTTKEETQKTIHHGRNVKRFREMLGIKQEALAYELGGDWNQKKVSLLESKEIIETDVLEQVAKILKVPVEAFQNFDEEAAVAFFNTFNDNSTNHGTIGNNYNCELNFNPVDKVVELFERLLASEKEKTDLMKEILEKMGK